MLTMSQKLILHVHKFFKTLNRNKKTPSEDIHRTPLGAGISIVGVGIEQGFSKHYQQYYYGKQTECIYASGICSVAPQ